VLQPKTNQKVLFGDEINWELSSEDGVTIDSFNIEGMGESVSFQGKKGAWVPKTPKTGSPKLKLTVFSGDKKEVHYPRLKFYPSEAPKQYSYKVVNTYPHDTESYIQGFLIRDGVFIESTGQRGQSKLRKIEPQSGRVIKEIKLKDQYFGEGCTIWNDKIYQLTWESQTLFIYDMELNEQGTLNYPTAGWGLANYANHLLLSDGSERIYFMEPEGFVEKSRIEVYNNVESVDNLNELETINGQIFANVYGKEIVVIIDPESGAVTGEIDFTGLMSRAAAGTNMDYVLNGIAYDEQNDKLFVTGKLWDTIFEVELIEKTPS